MARPKKEDAGKARQRIIDAFWEMLAVMPYEHIGIRSLSKQAQVNPNTFYRYFENVDDLARKAFDENLMREVPMMVLRLFSENEMEAFSLFEEVQGRPNVKRMFLVARSGSNFLTQMLEDTIMAFWLDQFEVAKEDMDEIDLIELSALVGGWLVVLRRVAQTENIETAHEIAQRPLFRAAIASLSDLWERYRARAHCRTC